MNYRKFMVLSSLFLFCNMFIFSIGSANEGCDIKKGDQTPGDMHAVDGPGMMNPNVWKHARLDGQWVAPEGDVAAEVSGFDYKLGVYKLGEADNFAWLKNRFYFSGATDATSDRNHISLNLNSPTVIKDSEGNELANLKEMWEEKGTLFVKLVYVPAGTIKVRQLRRPHTILE